MDIAVLKVAVPIPVLWGQSVLEQEGEDPTKTNGVLQSTSHKVSCLQTNRIHFTNAESDAVQLEVTCSAVQI